MPRPAAWRTTTSHARFLSAFVALTLALSGGLLSAGVIVDPHGLFGTGRYPVLVATSRSEKVASLATASPPQALIFGSSIMMRVDPAVVERLTKLTTFNLSVDSGKSEDFVALLEYGVRDLRLRPRLAIVGLSPRTFTSMENEGFDDRLLANDRLLRYVPMNPAVRALRRAAVYLGTLDWTYMNDVTRSLQASRAKAALGATKYTFERDGFLRTEESFNTRGWYERWAGRKPDAGVPGLSAERTRYFEIFRALCREFGIELIVIVTPDDPEVIAYANSRLNGLYDRLNQQLLAYLHGLSTSDPFEVHDFSRIEHFGGVNEFMGSHPSIRNGTLMLERMFAGRR